MHSLDEFPHCELPANGLSLIIDGPLSATLILGGVLGNIYCLRILYRTSINTGMLVSLTALAIWDMVLLLASFWHHALWATLHVVGLHKQPWDPYIVALSGLLECAHITSTWMLLEVSATRFMAISRPFRRMSVSMYQHKIDRSNYVRLIAGLIRLPVGLTAIACIFTIPCSFEYELQPCNLDRLEYYQRQETGLMRNPVYFMFYKTILLAMLKTLGPFAVITVLTMNTVRSMRKSMDSRATILKQQGKCHLFEADKDKTKSLQTISTLLLGKFLLFRCWPTVIDVARVLTGAEHSPLVEHLAEFLLLLNSATNSLVFVVLKSAFETRRLNRVRARHRDMVAKHAEQVLCIGKALARDHLFSNEHGEIPDIDADSDR